MDAYSVEGKATKDSLAVKMKVPALQLLQHEQPFLCQLGVVHKLRHDPSCQNYIQEIKRFLKVADKKSYFPIDSVFLGQVSHWENY